MTGAPSVEPFALAWAKEGFVVLPGRRFENQPHPMLGAGWTHQTIGSTDPTWVFNCWNMRGSVHAHRRLKDEARTLMPMVSSGDPAANVFVICGWRSRLLLLDLDIRDGKDGVASLLLWQDEVGWELPEAPMARTPGGGFHLFFGIDADETLRKKVGWLPGVDALAAGAGTAVWPSARKLPGLPTPKDPRPEDLLVEYDFINGASLSTLRRDMPPAPGWLVEDIRSRPASRPSSPGGVRSAGGSGSNLPPTDELLTVGFTPKRCDDEAHALACRLARISDPVTAEAVMREVWELTMANVPGDPSRFTWGHMLDKLDRARAWVEGQRPTYRPDAPKGDR